MSAVAPPPPPMTEPRNFPSDPAQVGAVRQYVLAHLDPADPRRDDVELLTSEVVTNAIKYTERAVFGVDVSVRVSPSELAVIVTDGGGAGEPVVRSNPEQPRDHGRGMVILDALADRWGTGRVPGGGTQVWFVLRAPVAFER
jgi:serine/threonine-protein kinase RsbW